MKVRAMILKARLADIKKGKIEGFTTFLGKDRGRYVVGFMQATISDNPSDMEISSVIEYGITEGAHTIGGWFNGINYELDYGTLFDDLREAKDYAIEHKQEAIYDLQEEKEIPVDEFCVYYHEDEHDGRRVFLKSHESIWEASKKLNGMRLVRSNITTRTASALRIRLEMIQQRINEATNELHEVMGG